MVKTMEPLNRMKLERDCAEIRDELEFKHAQIRDSLSSLQKKVDAKVCFFFHPENKTIISEFRRGSQDQSTDNRSLEFDFY